jgi:hypothetical protein
MQLGDWFWALLELSRALSREQSVDLAMIIFNQYFTPKGVSIKAIESASRLLETLDEENILDAVDFFAER